MFTQRQLFEKACKYGPGFGLSTKLYTFFLQVHLGISEARISLSLLGIGTDSSCSETFQSQTPQQDDNAVQVVLRVIYLRLDLFQSISDIKSIHFTPLQFYLKA